MADASVPDLAALMQGGSAHMRYMRHYFRIDLLQAVLANITAEKREGLAASLDKQHKDMVTKMGELGSSGLPGSLPGSSCLPA